MEAFVGSFGLAAGLRAHLDGGPGALTVESLVAERRPIQFMRLPSLLLLWCSGLLGQPVLQPFDVNPLGYTADIIAAEFIEPTPASDQPQAWDFSGVSGSAVALFALEPSTLSPFNDAFSGAEWTNTVGDQVSFWALQEGDFTILGNANVTNGVTLPFDDPSFSGPFRWDSAMSWRTRFRRT